MSVKTGKKLKTPIKIIIIALTLALTFALGFFSRCITEIRSYRTLNEVLNLINKHSVCVEEVDLATLTRTGVNGVLSTDKYAKYYTQEEYDKDKEQDEGNYSGFGLNFYTGTNKIYSAVYNSPAERAGIESGDIIAKICVSGGQVLVSDFNGVSSALKNVKTGEEVEFTLIREGVGEYSTTLKKEEYKASYVRYFDNSRELKVRTNESGDYYLKEFTQNKNALLDDKTACIEITEFSGDLAYQLELALGFMKDNKKEHLILDLKNNGGGRLDILQEVCALFLPSSAKSGDLLVLAKLKNGEKEFCLKKQGKNDFIKNTVILANYDTASASEALIGAMHHYGAGGFNLSKLVCEYNESRENFSTFGKGIMQTTYGLTSGGALKLTTAKIYWPDKSTCIHDTGILPKNAENFVAKELHLDRAMEIFASY
jgi:carboxyl-terminal processing protease